MATNRDTVLQTADASANQTSSVIPAQNIIAISAHAIVTVASTGTLKFQASNDQPGVVGSSGAVAPVNWVDIASQTVTVGAAGNFLIPKFDVSYQWLQLVWTKNNGSAGTVTVNVKWIAYL